MLIKPVRDRWTGSSLFYDDDDDEGFYCLLDQPKSHDRSADDHFLLSFHKPSVIKSARPLRCLAHKDREEAKEVMDKVISFLVDLNGKTEFALSFALEMNWCGFIYRFSVSAVVIIIFL